MKTMIAAGLAALTLSAGCARAQGEQAGGDKLTLADYQARRVAELMKADTNHDGRISRDEFTAAMQARMAARGGGEGGDAAQMADRLNRMFGRMDRDGDGFITQAEIEQSAADRFARMDVDHKGYVTADERRQGRGGGREGQGDGR